MTIEETIRRQASAVKANSNNAKAAELLIQAANLLKGNQPAPAAFSRLDNISRQQRGRDRFAGAMFANKEADKKKLLSDAHNDLTADGWKPVTRNPQTGGGSYSHSSMPGHELKIDPDGTFSVTKGAELVVPKTHLKNLKGMLKQIKPK